MELTVNQLAATVGAGGMTSGQAYVPVAAGVIATLPVLGLGQVMRVLIDAEFLTITGYDTVNNRLNVNRAQDGSSAAAHAAGAPIYAVPTAGMIRGMQSGALLDHSETDQPTTLGVEGTNWITVNYLQAGVPAGVPFVIEADLDVGIYAQNAAVGTNIDVDFRVINSAGNPIQTPGSGLQHRIRLQTTVASEVKVVPRHLYVPIVTPLAADDQFTLQGWCTASGSPTASQGVAVPSGVASMRSRVL